MRSGMEEVRKIRETIGSFFVGKEDVIDHMLICLIGGGHVLLEDVPGIGKTTLARCFAQVISASFGRLQFTPDTLPGDVVGVSVYNSASGRFEYRPGVIMHQILLADEINRTSPKTQASLLEAMAEGQVTVDGQTHPLPQPFLVIATQNPNEYIGTYPLPEAQLDRFMMRLSVGYPERSQELKMAAMFLEGASAERLPAVCEAERIAQIRAEAEQVQVKESVLGYLQDIVELTRREPRFLTGASPRALLSLLRAAQARAYLEEREYVIPDDIKQLAVPVLAHRLVLTPEARIGREDVAAIVRELVLKAKVPV